MVVMVVMVVVVVMMMMVVVVMMMMMMMMVVVVWVGVRIDNVALSSHRALAGDTLTATCDVHRYRPIEPPETSSAVFLVYWVRKTPNRQRVVMAVNRVLNVNFHHTGRYSAGYLWLDRELRQLQFQLNITGQLPALVTIIVNLTVNNITSVLKSQ